MPELKKLSLTGFRCFAQTQTLEIDSNLVLISGPNSQGKTAVVESIEFLLTGTLMRRELLGGAKAEFSSCIRNANLADDAPVVIEAVFELDGTEHTVRRELVSDFTANDDCVSRLTLDGEEVEDLSALGLRVSDPPLRGPILVQHSLRYALSVNPGDRAKYFRSIMEVDDLETARTLIAGMRESVIPEENADVDHLAAVLELDEMAEIDSDVLQFPVGESEFTESMKTVIGKGAEVVDVELEDDDDLRTRAEKLEVGLEVFRDRDFPLHAIAAIPEFPEPEEFETTPLGEFAELAADTDEEARRIVALLTAVLDVPSCSEIDHEIDCPVCGAEGSLTPERISTIREDVESHKGFSDGQEQAYVALGEIESVLKIDENAIGRMPEFLTWDAPSKADARLKAEALLGTQNVLDALVDESAVAKAALTDATSKLAAVLEKVADCRAEIGSFRQEDADEIDQFLADYQAARAALVDASILLESDLETTNLEIRTKVDERAGLAEWTAVAETGREPDNLRAALLDRRAMAATQKDLDEALEAVDVAKGVVFDEKFADLSQEVEFWWELLRPEETLGFSRLEKRGSGSRFINMKASILRADGETVERDMLGVGSDSQLNALGLASFLARTVKQGSPLVALDDPVQAGDGEHRLTFVCEVIPELLDREVQVIVVAYDDQLCDLMRDRYRANNAMDEYSVELVDRAEGATVTLARSKVMNYLNQAKPYLRRNRVENRQQASHLLRPAAERLAKEIIVLSRRDAGDTCEILDYNGQTLEQLVEELSPYLRDESDRGDWRSLKTILNPGNHDDTPPEMNSLKSVDGWLRTFHNRYVTSHVPVPVEATST